MTWAERAAERSPGVQRSRSRGVEHATAIVEAAQRLIAEKGSGFTTQELVREAGIALRTFYRYFEGKDQLVLAVIEHLVSGAVEAYRQRAEGVDDPVARLRLHVTGVIEGLGASGDLQAARFLATEHWRLQALHPEQVAQASQSYNDLVRDEIAAATDAGLLHPRDPARAAWFVTQLVQAVFHYYAFVEPSEPIEAVSARIWDFCVAGLGAR